jgi:hypothetical protein
MHSKYRWQKLHAKKTLGRPRTILAKIRLTVVQTDMSKFGIRRREVQQTPPIVKEMQHPVETTTGLSNTCSPTGVLCDFAHTTSRNVHLLRIQIYCCKADHTRDTHFPHEFHYITQQRKMFQMKVVELNGIYILLF